MRLEKTEAKTETYSAGGGFMVDIVTFPENEFSEAWLYHEDYSVKEMMFGLKKEDMTTEIIWRNLPEYLPGYMEKYFN